MAKLHEFFNIGETFIRPKNSDRFSFFSPNKPKREKPKFDHAGDPHPGDLGLGFDVGGHDYDDDEAETPHPGDLGLGAGIGGDSDYNDDEAETPHPGDLGLGAGIGGHDYDDGEAETPLPDALRRRLKTLIRGGRNEV